MQKQTNVSDNHFGPWLLLGGFAIAGLIIWLGVSYQGGVQQGQVSETSRDVALSCTTDDLTRFHIHPHLSIIMFGKNQTIPADIGITMSCLHAVHTHDDTGTIHVESPVQKDFTLGDFFAVWNEPFTKEQILDTKLSATNTVIVSVNGKAVDTFDQTVMHDLDQIVIEVK